VGFFSPLAPLRGGRKKRQKKNMVGRTETVASASLRSPVTNQVSRVSPGKEFKKWHGVLSPLVVLLLLRIPLQRIHLAQECLVQVLPLMILLRQSLHFLLGSLLVQRVVLGAALAVF
jgi:hypothetical protein